MPLNTPPRRIPLIICIDVEPDDRRIDPSVPRDWFGFEETWNRLQQLRQSLAEAIGPVRFSWFLRMDPQVKETYGSADWVFTRYTEHFRDMDRLSDEIGLHPHAWRWSESEQNWVSDFADPQWVEHCIRMSFASFEDCFKRSCRCFRFGDRWMNNRIMKLVDSLGAQFDLTIEPGYGPERIPESSTAELPDYTMAPRSCYRPSRANYLRPGNRFFRRNVWVIPVSTVAVNRASTPLTVESLDRHLSSVGETYEGNFEHAEPGGLWGWVWNQEKPDETVCIDVFENANHIGTYAAEFFRADLLHAGKGSGAHGFRVPAPKLRTGETQEIRIKCAGTEFELGNSPRYISDSSRPEDYVTMNLACEATLFRRLFDALVKSNDERLLTFVLRTDSVLAPSTASSIERNLAYIMSHPLSGQFEITTPPEALRILRG